MQEYLVFRCNKCNQYTYAKTTQKGKKCPRCGRNHIIKEVSGEIVEGCTSAMNLVIKYQNGISKNKLPKFSSSKKEIIFKQHKREKIALNSFTTANNVDTFNNHLETHSRDTKENQQRSMTILVKFMDMITDFQNNEGITKCAGFPEYILDLLVKEMEISNTKREILKEQIKSLPNFIVLHSGNIFLDRR